MSNSAFSETAFGKSKPCVTATALLIYERKPFGYFCVVQWLIVEDIK